MKRPAEILDELVEHLHEAQLAVAQKEAELKEANRTVARLLEEDIPSIMDEIGSDKVTTPNGHVVSVKADPKASVTQDRMPLFVKWLDERGHGGMVKRDLIIAFSKDSQEEANALMERLRMDGKPVKLKPSIHWQTLNKWARDRLEAGEEVPMHLVEIFDRRVATVR